MLDVWNFSFVVGFGFGENASFISEKLSKIDWLHTTQVLNRSKLLTTCKMATQRTVRRNCRYQRLQDLAHHNRFVVQSKYAPMKEGFEYWTQLDDVVMLLNIDPEQQGTSCLR
ncbi:uncharacterized protein ARMOST_11027 [Armillaria ostoyae]|uniref:Uncharacterized protein n=1 Tax=Armillaria ostoyae TaxID=47428 RepID=A0A284RFZ6_ARMOS|nr:uncharacterized protein ARMOST_11027 [Armillaria ostoyae]